MGRTFGCGCASNWMYFCVPSASMRIWGSDVELLQRMQRIEAGTYKCAFVTPLVDIIWGGEYLRPHVRKRYWNYKPDVCIPLYITRHVQWHNRLDAVCVSHEKKTAIHLPYLVAPHDYAKYQLLCSSRTIAWSRQDRKRCPHPNCNSPVRISSLV